MVFLIRFHNLIADGHHRFREYFGSCIIMEIRAPRIVRH